MRSITFIAVFPALLAAEVLSDRSLNGKYHFVHLQVGASRTGHVTNVNSAGGTIVFNGAGTYTATGKRAAGRSAAEAFSTSGTYAILSDGRVRFSGIGEPDAPLNARLGTESGLLLGSSTESPRRMSDLFVAVLAPERATTGLIRGTYALGTLSFPGTTLEAFSTALTEMTVDGEGAVVAQTRVHERRNVEEGVEGMTRMIGVKGSYTLNPDGTGGMFIGDNASDLFVSTDGEILLAVSGAADRREITVGVRNETGAIDGNYWVAEMLLDTEIAGATRVSSSVGAARSSPAGRMYLSQRLVADERWRNLTAMNLYNTGTGGWGQIGPTLEDGLVNFASGRRAFIAAQVGPPGTITHLQGLMVGYRMPIPTGSGLFLSPHGISGVISDLPPTSPQTRGAEVVLHGAGFAEQSAEARDEWPTELGGIRVTVNGTRAALGQVGSDRIRLRIPDGEAGAAAFVVQKGGLESNSVSVDLAQSAPAIVAQDGSSGELAAMETVGANDEVAILAAGIRADASVTAFIAGRGARVLSVSAGPRPGLSRITLKAPPSLPFAPTAPLALAADDGFTCLLSVPLKKR